MSRRESVPGRGDPGAERVQEDIETGHVARSNGHGSAARPRPLLGFVEVLYIDDDPASLALVGHLLERNTAFTFRSAERGRLGVELARALQPDVILLDLRLPDLPGAQVLATLRSGERTASIPVIVISADADPEVPARVLSAGASAFMIKPIDLGALLAAIAAVIHR